MEVPGYVPSGVPISPEPTAKDWENVTARCDAGIRRGAGRVMVKGESGIVYEVPLVVDWKREPGTRNIGHDDTGFICRFREEIENDAGTD